LACGVADVEDGDDAAVTVGVSAAPPALRFGVGFLPSAYALG